MKKAFSFSQITLGSTLVAALLSVVPLRVVASPAEYVGVIINSGSTNTCPYTIFVPPNGQAIYTVCDISSVQQISPSSLATKFLNDISAAEPLSKLPFTPCVKSASFGTTTKVKYNTQTSPDISCPSSDSKVTNLSDDAEAIQKALGFNTSRNPL